MGSIGLRDCAEGRSVVSSVSGVGFAFDDGGLRKGDRTLMNGGGTWVKVDRFHQNVSPKEPDPNAEDLWQDVWCRTIEQQ